MDHPRSPKVLHLISSLRVGGAERLLVSTMTAARGNDLANFVVCIMNDEIDAGFLGALSQSGFPVYQLGRREGHLHPRYLRRILSIIDAHAIDVVHTHNEGSRTWGMLAKLLRPRLKLVYTVHAEGIARQIRGWRQRAYHRLVDATVAISGFVKQECEAFGARNVALIENGIDLGAFQQQTAPDRKAGAPRLINVARFARIKGQDILIEALKRCHDQGHRLHLTLVGIRSEPGFHDHLVELVRQRGLDDYVSFEIDRTDLADLLGQADLFVLPSRHEGFGLVLIEAMAAGLPVIAARTGGAAELVRDGETGLTFAPEDPEDLARQILAMIADPAGMAGYVTRGAGVARRYDISATLTRHLRLYQDLATTR